MEKPLKLAQTSSVESIADIASLPRYDSVQTWGRVRSVPRVAWTFLQRYLGVVLGAVLLLAGALKGQQLLTDPSAGRASGFPRELLIGASAFELAFGCWMLAGLYRRLTRWLSIGWFTSLAAVALAQALGGAPTCACLGELHVHPWLMFAFDVLSVAALWMWSPAIHSSLCHLPSVLCLSLLPAAVLLGLAGAYRHQPPIAEIDLGDIVQGGQKEQAFQIRNDSGTLAEVAAIETSCPCASIHLERTEVPAGQFLAGNLTLDLRPKPGFLGDLAIEAKGLTRRGRVAFVLVIRARVYRASQEDKGALAKQERAS
jgi:hypothetical protein